MKKETTVIDPSEDLSIIREILSGRQYLYEQLMRKYNQRLYRVALSILNDEDEIEDVMQTAYLNAFVKLPSFQGNAAFSTWLTRILINECLQRKKKMARTEKLSEHEEARPASHSPLKDLMNKELKLILEKTISALPEKYRTVFMMREIEEFSTAETMEILNLSESNVKVRLNRAKEMLRTSLNREYQHAHLFEFNLVRCDRIVKAVMSRIAGSVAL